VKAYASFSFVGGGQSNTAGIGASYATVGGGYDNRAAEQYATVAGGAINSVRVMLAAGFEFVVRNRRPNSHTATQCT